MGSEVRFYTQNATLRCVMLHIPTGTLNSQTSLHTRYRDTELTSWWDDAMTPALDRSLGRQLTIPREPYETHGRVRGLERKMLDVSLNLVQDLWRIEPPMPGQFTRKPLKGCHCGAQNSYATLVIIQ